MLPQRHVPSAPRCTLRFIKVYGDEHGEHPGEKARAKRRNELETVVMTGEPGHAEDHRPYNDDRDHVSHQRRLVRHGDNVPPWLKDASDRFQTVPLPPRS